MTGIGVGSLIFAVLYPYIEGFYISSAMGSVTLPQLLKINHWFVMVLLYVLAAGMFYLMERFEKRI